MPDDFLRIILAIANTWFSGFPTFMQNLLLYGVFLKTMPSSESTTQNYGRLSPCENRSRAGGRPVPGRPVVAIHSMPRLCSTALARRIK